VLVSAPQFSSCPLVASITALQIHVREEGVGLTCAPCDKSYTLHGVQQQHNTAQSIATDRACMGGACVHAGASACRQLQPRKQAAHCNNTTCALVVCCLVQHSNVCFQSIPTTTTQAPVRMACRKAAARHRNSSFHTARPLRGQRSTITRANTTASYNVQHGHTHTHTSMHTTAQCKQGTEKERGREEKRRGGGVMTTLASPHHLASST